jgi:hypothetical protein
MIEAFKISIESVRFELSNDTLITLQVDLVVELQALTK